MRTQRRLAVALLLLAATIMACSEADSVTLEGVNEGNQALDFSLPSLEGQQVSLSDFEGSVVLVNFWATWCPPCQAEIPDFEDAFRERAEDGFVVLGVNVEESASQVEPFVSEMGVTYPVLLDEGGKVKSQYRALGLPTSLLVDGDGVIRLRHVGILSGSKLEKHLSDLMSDR